jgi:HAMP domain-containing protein
MRALEFLSLRGEATPRSPLDRALRPVPGFGLRDLSLELAKLEVRGDLAAVSAGELIRITPRRGLVVAPIEEAEAIEAALRAQVDTVIDRTGALAALRIEGPRSTTLMRRLTDLDLDALPAAGAVARVPALVRDGFELFWAQEYGHYLAEVVVDMAQGLA